MDDVVSKSVRRTWWDEWILTANQSHDSMGNGLEEEESIPHIDFDLHHHAGGDDIEEDNDVEGADGVQNHVPWASQGFLEFRHHNSGAGK